MNHQLDHFLFQPITCSHVIIILWKGWKKFLFFFLTVFRLEMFLNRIMISRNSATRLLCIALMLMLFAAIAMAAGKDYYKILGVSQDASTHEIKRQYKMLSRKHHPDKNPGDEKAHERFIELAEAYEVLTDEEKREIYNRYGEEGLKNQGGAGGAGGGFHDPFDIFAQFFGGSFRSGQRSSGARAKPRGPDVLVRVPVTLLELYTGTEVDVDIVKQGICPHCAGSGAASPEDVETCKTCGGSGVRIVKQVLGPGIIQQMQSTCDKCNGKGKTIAKPCPQCEGTRVSREADILTVRVEPGMGSDEEIVFDGEADQHPDHDPGSVIFRLVQQPHQMYTRHGDDLHAEVSITLLDALAGFNRTVQHVDPKEDIVLRRSRVTPPGFVQRLRGKGMPRRHKGPGGEGNGDMFIAYWIQFPAELDAKAKEQIAAVFGKPEGKEGGIGWDKTNGDSAKDASDHRGHQAPSAGPRSNNDDRLHDEL